MPNGHVLAHSLLPIRGRAPRHQPAVGRRGVLAFTGELWDVTQNRSDTDVVLARLESIGPRKAFRSFHGNWAIVYLSSHDGYIHFATDRLGEQPLHFAYDGTRLSVATEIKTLVAAGHPFEAVRPVVPGIHYTYSGELFETTYKPGGSDAKYKSFCKRVLRRRIAEAVRSQAAAHDPRHEVVILLSGGIDSTIIAFEAAKSGVTRAFTVAVDARAPDAINAARVARELGLDWELVLAPPASPTSAVACAEIANRSIVEELCMHLHLAARLQELGIHIALTGSGADELFVGYGHLLGRVPHHALQERFLSTYYRFDLRAVNKIYGGYQVEVRNPFLSRHLVEYARRIPGDVLIGPSRALKWPLRETYRDVLGAFSTRPKLIARETMGVKSLFQKRFGLSPYIYRPLLKSLLRSSAATLRAISCAPTRIKTKR
ncbi:MAG: asparagine synthase-related protein [Candidatus Rokubacteria bacterium]|nr:asparagine synthase-related protein [Candidatus Rokubacteria bacterium]